MQNALLVGLSRQVALGRELDVVANNIANLNTVGFKADGAVFEEYIGQTARSGNLPGTDSRVSFVHDRATWIDHEPGPARAHRQLARRRHRRLRLPGGADAARRALHAQRRAAHQRQRRTGDQRRLSGARRLRPDHVSAEGSRHHDQRGRHHQRARRRQRQDRIAARQAAHGRLRLSRPAAEGRLQHLHGAARRHARRPIRPRASSRARSRNPTCAAWSK